MSSSVPWSGEQPPPKKPRTGCVGEPDVIVVVGGTEFYEHSGHLRSWSKYFDGAFRSGMKETDLMRFEFPHRKPKEWELLTSWLKPFSATQIDKSNYTILLSWCDELIIPEGLNECDKFLDESGFVSVEMDKYAVGIVRCNLKRSKARYLDMIKQPLAESPHDNFSADNIKMLATLMEEDEECYEALCPCFQKLLPDIFPNDRKDQMDFIGSELFPFLVITKRERLDLSETNDRVNEQVKKLVKAIDETPDCTTAKTLRRELVAEMGWHCFMLTSRWDTDGEQE